MRRSEFERPWSEITLNDARQSTVSVVEEILAHVIDTDTHEVDSLQSVTTPSECLGAAVRVGDRGQLASVPRQRRRTRHRRGIEPTRATHTGSDLRDDDLRGLRYRQDSRLRRTSDRTQMIRSIGIKFDLVPVRRDDGSDLSRLGEPAPHSLRIGECRLNPSRLRESGVVNHGSVTSWMIRR